MMMDLDSGASNEKWLTAVLALLSLLAVAMGGAWAFTSGIAHDYVAVREYDHGMKQIEDHLGRIELHLNSVDQWVHDKK